MLSACVLCASPFRKPEEKTRPSLKHNTGVSMSPRGSASWSAAGCWLGGASVECELAMAPGPGGGKAPVLYPAQAGSTLWWALFGMLQLSNPLST